MYIPRREFSIIAEAAMANNIIYCYRYWHNQEHQIKFDDLTTAEKENIY